MRVFLRQRRTRASHRHQKNSAGCKSPAQNHLTHEYVYGTLIETHDAAQRVHDAIEAVHSKVKHCSVHVNPLVIDNCCV